MKLILAQLPSTTILSPHDRDEAIRWLKSMPFASKYLFTPTDTMSEQLKGQWNTLPMGKKKGGLCQRNPQAAKQIIEKFGSFLSFLIRLYPTITGQAYSRNKVSVVTYSTILNGTIVSQSKENLREAFRIKNLKKCLLNKCTKNSKEK